MSIADTDCVQKNLPSVGSYVIEATRFVSFRKLLPVRLGAPESMFCTYNPGMSCSLTFRLLSIAFTA